MEHKITTMFGSEPESMGYRDWRQSICSCGWEGRKHYNYENYAYTNCAEEAQEHLRQHHTPEGEKHED